MVCTFEDFCVFDIIKSNTLYMHRVSSLQVPEYNFHLGYKLVMPIVSMTCDEM